MTQHEMLQAAVIRRAEAAGLTVVVAHPWKSTAGAPDLVLFGPTKIVAAELKSEDGRRSQAQVNFARPYRPNLEYRLWRPSNLTSGEIDGQIRWFARNFTTGRNAT